MKKKGFTLIELLAVIIILAVIALIAAPVVLNIIEQVKIKGAESSAKGYAKAVEYEILNDTMFKGKNLDGEYDVEENILEVVYQGNGPSEGYFILENDSVKYGEFCINGYGIKYENSMGKYSPDEVMCSDSIIKHEFLEPSGTKSKEICDGTVSYDEETNFKIKTVEDLVCVSKLSSNGKTFSGKTVMLLSDIDIKDSNSYNDINDTSYGDINGNGTVEGIQVELTTGQGFLSIGTSSSVPFSGTFEGYGFTLSNLMINRSSDNVGLFGYVTNGIIKGLNINNITVTGSSNVGGVVGYLNSGTVNEISISGTIVGTSLATGGAIGYNYKNENVVKSILLSDINVTGNSSVGGIIGQGHVTYMPVYGIIEKGTVKGNAYATDIVGRNNYSGNSYSSSSVTVSCGTYCTYGGTHYTLRDDMLSAYDDALDTWIGGDNDSSGYYFDYDENNKIIVKSVEREPITFTLKGKGTEENPYLINNYQQWKEATTKVKQDVYFKLNVDIDFDGKHYYAMGTNGNYLVATLDGNSKTISNINIEGFNNAGLIGYNNGGTIKGLNVKDVTITSNYSNIGGIVGYNNSGTIVGMNIENITVSGVDSIGGVVGYLNTGVVNEVNLSGTVIGSGLSAGGAVGHNYKIENTVKSILISDINVTGGNNVGGIVGTNYVTGMPIYGIIEKGTVKGNTYATDIVGRNSYSGNSYSSSLLTVNCGTSCTYGITHYILGDDMLSTYDGTLDTWIGGDNDSSGYYFDYDENNKIIVKSVEKNPITFSLSGSGTSDDPYLINSYQQWKEATTKVKQNVYFKLNVDIDFSNKPYYAMGTNGNYLMATIDGNNKTISNIAIEGFNNAGLISYNNGGTVKGLNVKDVTIASRYSNIGGIVGYNNTGSIVGINIENITVSGIDSVGGVVGYLNSGTVNEISITGTVIGSGVAAGGAIGYNYKTENVVKSILISNINVTGANNVGGIIGQGHVTYMPVYGIIEKGTVKGNTYASRIVGRNNYSGNSYSSSLLTVNCGTSCDYASANYTLELPTTVTYTENNNRIEVDSLSYYNNGGALDTVIGGDNDNSGYYFDYNSTGNKIIVVPVGGIGTINPGGNVGTVEIDSNYTMTQINGTTDTTAPTCELYYVRAVSNGIQASFSCTDDSGVPTLRSLFDSTTSKSAATFDNIGTLKNGSVSGNTKTVVSTWNVNNAISQPTKGTCYYFRYGAKDAQNNFSTYVTNVCYTCFSE